jgi:hypothetical protein
MARYNSWTYFEWTPGNRFYKIGPEHPVEHEQGQEASLTLSKRRAAARTAVREISTLASQVATGGKRTGFRIGFLLPNPRQLSVSPSAGHIFFPRRSGWSFRQEGKKGNLEEARKEKKAKSISISISKSKSKFGASDSFWVSETHLGLETFRLREDDHVQWKRDPLHPARLSGSSRRIQEEQKVLRSQRVLHQEEEGDGAP